MTAGVDYGAEQGRGTIRSIDPHSPAARAGIAPGGSVVGVDGHPVRDIIDWRWWTDADAVSISVIDESGAHATFELEREPGETWGIEFGSAIFDRVHTCRNDCTFCFMAQLPEGLRAPLYLRDDDYRLSFLQGNFVTLTNLSDDDVTRIAEQRLSPLYVSLHAIDPEIRSQLVNAQSDETLARFDQLARAGIQFHVQIVLVPGVNDGEELDRTLEWLEQRPTVVSVGIVPLGYTRFQERFDRSYENPTDAAMVIQQVQRWQFERMDRKEPMWVYLADEIYLNARAPLPATERYDDFPQYENGIGLVRTFVDDVMRLRTQMQTALLGLPAEEESVTIVTGMMAATTMAGALDACDAVGRVRLLVVPNAFFGGNVSVAGLLTGRDVVSGIAADDHEGAYVLPDVIFNAEGLTLDGMTIGDIRENSSADIRVVSADAGGLLAALQIGAC